MLIRELRKDGMTYSALARQFGLSLGTVHRVVNAEPGENTVSHPALNYWPRFDDDEWEAMTDLQKREHDESLARIFNIQTELKMTMDRARVAVNLTFEELMEREDVDRAQAGVIKRTAWQFLERLERGNMEGNK